MSAPIIQIIPTSGVWFAIIGDEAVQVACWALVSSGPGMSVVPMVPQGSSIVNATQLDGYIEAVPGVDDDEEEEEGSDE